MSWSPFDTITFEITQIEDEGQFDTYLLMCGLCKLIMSGKLGPVSRGPDGPHLTEP